MLVGVLARCRAASMLEFWIEADAFMRHMNRVLVGTMLEVAGGRRTVDEFAGAARGRPRSEAGATAPAHGLYSSASATASPSRVRLRAPIPYPD